MSDIAATMSKIFDKYDVDKSGQLDLSESKLLLDEFSKDFESPLNQDEKDQILYWIDSNEDGVITKFELVRFMTKNLG